MENLLYENAVMYDWNVAAAIGINESIIITQFDMWVRKCEKNADSDCYRNGKYWVRISYPELQKYFPFWSEQTIKRTIVKLEKIGVLISENFNTDKFDRTKWYTVDNQKLANIRNSEVTTGNEWFNFSEQISMFF